MSAAVPEITPRWVSWTADSRRARLAATPVVVLLGGTSSEREVSLTSGAAMLEALQPAGSPPIPASVTAVEIDPRGQWVVGTRSLSPSAAVERLPEGALYVLALHGGAGEDGTLQGFLETLGCAYTGSGVAASALCLDKVLSRARFLDAGVSVAEGLSVTRQRWGRARSSLLGRIQALGKGPWYVKPVHGGSSLTTGRAEDPVLLEAMIEAVLASGDEALVERGVQGVEVTVGIVGSATDREALPLVEIRPRGDEFFDYEQKYSAEGAEEICPPRSLSAERQRAVQQEALTVWELAGLEGYARVDFIVPDDDGPPVVLEANTLPGFTPRSLLPQAAAADGVGFRDLVLEICSRALDRAEGQR